MNETLIRNSFSASSIDVLVRKVLLGCLLFSLSIFTIMGNLLVLYAIRTEKRLRTVSNLFILSLAFADLIVGVSVMPLSAANIIVGRWPFSSVLCQMWLSVDYVASTASIFNLVLLSLDRYWAVVYPIRHFQNRSRKRATNFIIIIWFISFLWAPVVIFWSYLIPQHSHVNKPTECDTSFRSNKLFKTVAALFNFYLPLLSMIVISYRIMRAVRSRSTMEFGRRISSATQRQMKQERAYQNQMKIAACLSLDENENPPTSDSVRIDDNVDLTNANNNPDDDTESLSQLELNRSSLNHDSPFCFPSINPIKNLFPSLSSIREQQRKSVQSSINSSSFKSIKNSLSVHHDMKYPEQKANQISISLNNIPRAASISSLSDDSPQPMFTYSDKQQQGRSNEKITIQITSTSSSSSPTHVDNPTDTSNNQYLPIPTPSGPINPPLKMNILTFFEYILNPSLSSSLQKEIKAARQLTLLVGVFTFSLLPYFILFLVVAWCQHCVSDTVYTTAIWLGYLNSTVNPLIYPLCNLHFRRAFKNILYCHPAKSKLPNLGTFRSIRQS
ncbi:unnamed protein product [Adineta ricciae]|uniref:G-protein coupled receptors family 1 profile domain-containing protein n=1 Tax=Adineta ricciae TaxID=249248 RepID=A0A815MX19_ADIRI|nr:unnamed protein product [Adineta ricciae]CAF1426385.1 unnamed protein product [Adineta ricciae]